MRSHCREQRPYKFFKIVLPSNSNDNKLKLPPKFVKFFLDELPASATLTTPMGHVWPVRLEKASDNSCFIKDGWKEFAEHHSIDYGFFLVFGYEGVSNFRVSVFDLTACEIRYPINPSNCSENPYHGKHSSTKEETQDDDVSVEILGSSPPWQAPTSSGDSIIDLCVGEKTHRRVSNPLGINKKRKIKQGCFRGGKKHKMEDHLNRPSSSWKAQTKSVGQILNPDNPSFTAIMKQYKNRLLYVPTEFARKHLRKRSIKLLDSSGRQWRLECIFNGGKNVRLSRGWHEFFEAKNLKEGDVCVFELVQREDVVLKVFIFRQ